MIVGTQLISEVDATGITVEFVDDADNVISVRLLSQEVNRNNAVAKARQLLGTLVASGDLPDHLEDPKNQDGRAATLASSTPREKPDLRDADASAEDDIAHGRRTSDDAADTSSRSSDRAPNTGTSAGKDGRSQINPDSTPGTGMLPTFGEDDENMQPSS